MTGKEVMKVGEDSIPVPREVINKNSWWLSNGMVTSLRWERVIPLIPEICKAQGIQGVEMARVFVVVILNY
ncbi:hypothetical protein AAC387_Pa03g3116 [Persea americana]